MSFESLLVELAHTRKVYGDCYGVIAAVTQVVRELDRARQVHPEAFHSTHEGYAVLLEELDELWEEIRRKQPVPARVREEAVQVAAMALKFLIDCCLLPAREGDE